MEQDEAQMKEIERIAKLNMVVDRKMNPFDDKEEMIVETYEQMVNRRTEEILKTVWIEYDTRMYMKFSSKLEFYEANKERARELAEIEVNEHIQRMKEKEVRT